MERYVRQLALPEITPLQQERLKNTKILAVGAGGLGAVFLPYLAGAGIGHIDVMDHDAVDVANLHRQTVYKDAQVEQNKAVLMAEYLRDLNSEITVRAISEKLTRENMARYMDGYDFLLDGSDNFETKNLLNEISIAGGVPLISASVNGFEGQVGIFAGHQKDAPCYRCLFPELPELARNCNEAGILGTTAGLAGMYQAHAVLFYLLGISDVCAGWFANFDFKTLRSAVMRVEKNPDCAFCVEGGVAAQAAHSPLPRVLLVRAEDLERDAVVVDVRQSEELLYDPIDNAMHIPLPELPARFGELPRDRMLALVCAGNVRSVQGAEYLLARGFEKVCVLDKFSL